MQLERDQEHRSGDVPRPHPHADGDAAKDSVSRFMGILKGKSRLMLTRSLHRLTRAHSPLSCAMDTWTQQEKMQRRYRSIFNASMSKTKQESN